MSEIEDIADMEFDKLLQHIDVGELDLVESRTIRQDVPEELLDVVLFPVGNRYAK